MSQLHADDQGLRILKTTNTSAKTGHVPVTVFSNPMLLAHLELIRQRQIAGVA